MATSLLCLTQLSTYCRPAHECVLLSVGTAKTGIPGRRSPSTNALSSATFSKHHAHLIFNFSFNRKALYLKSMYAHIPLRALISAFDFISNSKESKLFAEHALGVPNDLDFPPLKTSYAL